MDFIPKLHKAILLALIFYAPMSSGGLLPAAEGAATKHPPYHIVLLISQNIRPYIEAVDGFREQLDSLMEAEVEALILDDYSTKARMGLAERFIESDKTDLLVTFGPEAARFAWDSVPEGNLQKIYSLILNPEKIIGNFDAATGISLNIPPEDQLRWIHKGLPSVSRVGLFYDPKNNRDFYDSALKATFEMDVDLVKLSVHSQKEIPFLLEECWDAIDCIWLIPDRTVIFESITQYIIKQSILHKIPVVGYNQFFYDSGAAMAFVFHYKDLGQQLANLVSDALKQADTGHREPVFKVWLNKAVLEKLEIKKPDTIESPLRVGP